ncbi:Hint domain-containing protein [Pelagovum sp. HNIBRBA483]|uniref:Hint domain-containing protein n=1 Tax=Pelagovum sp. HNIBRBA483 TaxID=3233341 RepID=UPI0034A204FB
MANTMTFYARGDSGPAANAALNAQGTTTTATAELTFSSGTSGDIELDYNAGSFDPDTTVFVDGVEMQFTVEFSGTLPITQRLSNVNGQNLQGEEIVVITTEEGQRYFFLSSGNGDYATMDAFPNGAHAIENLSSTGPVLICFGGGTRITTPYGDIPVEHLSVGDLVLTQDGRAVPIRWIGKKALSPLQLKLFPALRPITIPRDQFGPGLPNRPLTLSPQHRISFGGWQTEVLFGATEVLFAAKFLMDGVVPAAPEMGVEYFHLLFDQHEVILANGLASESFQPGTRGLGSLSPDDAAEISALFPDAPTVPTARPDAHQALRAHEARVLIEACGLKLTNGCSDLQPTVEALAA